MCDQVDMSVKRLWNGSNKAPNIPLCLLIHGDHKNKVFHQGKSMECEKKLRLQWALGRYLIEHTGVPAIMYAAQMVQIRQCYTDFLLKDKIRSILRWMHEEMPASALNQERHRWGYFRMPHTDRHLSNPTSLPYPNPDEELDPPEPRKFTHRRSLSEPRLIPPAPNRGYDTKALITAARRTVNSSFYNTGTDTLLRNMARTRTMSVNRKEIPKVTVDGSQLGCGDFAKEAGGISHLSVMQKRGQDPTAAAHLHKIFRALKRYQEAAYVELRTRLYNLLDDEDAEDTERRRKFTSQITWACHPWARKVTHLVLHFQVGEISREQIFKLATPLSYEHLRILRAFYLNFYAAFCNDPMECNERVLPNRHRAYSVHDVAKETTIVKKNDQLDALRKYRPLQMVNLPFGDTVQVASIIVKKHYVPWRLGDGRMIAMPKACLHHRKH
ncbi:uncharacterized protein LOC129586764 isoform X2 [Paramacrobiotus metropolitanus]|nr:uncharacterized protein LOC129586764 isoform X2 [Paramacrobiotus metropolitanus]